MSDCLYCSVDPRDSPLSDEHIIPGVLGGWLKYPCVCKSHNDQFGSDLESTLKKNVFVVRAIHSLGLQNLDKAYRHGRVTIETADGRELRGALIGSEPRLIPSGVSNNELVVPEETAKAILRKQIARFEEEHNVHVKWRADDFDSVPYDQLCPILETDISFIKRKGGSGFVRIDGLDAPISFRVPAKIALTHLAALGYPLAQSSSFDPLKTWILQGGDNRFGLIGRRMNDLALSAIVYKPYHYIKYRFVDPHLLALVTLFSAIRFGVYLAEIPELSQWPHFSALDRYHVYDIRRRVVFGSRCPNELEQDHTALLDAVLACHRSSTMDRGP